MSTNTKPDMTKPKEEKAKKKLIPRLRFPEFEEAGEWPYKPLRLMAKRCTQKNTDSKHLRVLTNSAEHGIIDQREYFEKDIANQGNLNGYYIVHAGDFVYNPRISSFAPVGPISRNNLDTGVMSPLYSVFRFLSVSDDFYAHYFQSNHWHSYVKQVSATGARHDRMNISTEALMDMPVPHPSLLEQRKIVDCLSSLDDLISAETRKLDALQKHKKGLMQQLFPAQGQTTPNLRFTEFKDAGEWRNLPLGQVASLLSGYPFDGKDIIDDNSGQPLMRGINITEGTIRHTNEIDRFYLGPTDHLEKYRLQVNDLVIGMDGSKVGKNSALVTEADKGSLLVQRVSRIRPKGAYSIQFIFHQICWSRFHMYVDRINTSSGIPHISAKHINEYPISITEKKEQDRITECLSALEVQIFQQSIKVNSLTLHKKALLHQLFPLEKH